MFKVLGSDQREYGPVSSEQLRQWIAQGRVNGQTRVQPEGSGEWKPLSEVPEFSDALRGGVRPAALAASPAAGAQQSGLAITSLVLGILSMVGCSIVAGIPAIITGHMARKRAAQAPGTFGGAGLALGGLIMGYISLAILPFVAIMAGLMLPALAKAKTKAQSIQCVNHLKQIGLAARIYAGDHNDRFPRDFLSMSNELVTPLLLVCKSDTTKTPVQDWSDFSSANVREKRTFPRSWRNRA